MALVDLSLALGRVRQDEGVDDDLVQACLDAATDFVIGWLNRQVFEDDESMQAAISAGTAGSDPMVANSAVKGAILKVLSDLYENPGNAATGTVTALPFGYDTLLRPFRSPSGP